MGRRSFVSYTLVLVCLLTSTDTSQVVAANMRSFVEAVRRKAAVVYVGSVKEVNSSHEQSSTLRHGQL